MKKEDHMKDIDGRVLLKLPVKKWNVRGSKQGPINGVT
jgi:hypothetical protein